MGRTTYPAFYRNYLFLCCTLQVPVSCTLVPKSSPVLFSSFIKGATHSALVWLLPRVPAHVHHQHVLGLEGPLLSGAVLPVAHKLLLLAVDVLVIYVLSGHKQTYRQKGRGRDMVTVKAPK